MNSVVFGRRLFYISAIVVLLIPLRMLGKPSRQTADGISTDEGGTLAKIRTEYRLGQGDLGEIDPASESMRLATLGLRGVAATILWQKAEYYKKEQFWDRLSATLNQIAVLQPHFIKVWEFQSHNLSYNVSSEFDNYQHRYQWVKRGIDYLIKGSKFNRHRTEMQYELGWYFGNKFGISDERLQFRELYRNDGPFHEEVLTKTGLDLRQEEGNGPDRKPDNWLGGRLWYERAYTMVEGGDKPARSTMMFYRMAPQWLMKHSEAIQAEGVLDEPARYAWRIAGREWRKFGERPIVTTFGDTIFLNELQRANEEYSVAKERFEEFCGETYDAMYAERRAQLSPEQEAAIAKDYADRSFEEVLLAEDAGLLLEIRPLDVARAMSDDKRVEALQIAKDLELKRGKISHIEIYRNQINYSYWTQRCIAEQEDAALAARVGMYEADQLLEKGELDAALERYDEAWIAWEELFNEHPAMMIDEAADEVMAAIDRYRRLLPDNLLPLDFGLAKFLQFRRIYDDQLADPGLMGVISEWPNKYQGRNFLDEMLSKSEDLMGTYDQQQALNPPPEHDHDEHANEVNAPEAVYPTEKPKDQDPPAEAAGESSGQSLEVTPPATGSAPTPKRDQE